MTHPAFSDRRSDRCTHRPGVASTASAVDMTQLTCEGLLAAGHDNVATMLTWLQGYHAGKNGRVSIFK
jgi:HdeA/HdeB family